MPKKERETLYSVPEASHLSNVPRRTLYYAIEKDNIRFTKISGRPFLTLEAIEEWKQGPHYVPEKRPRTKRTK